jgi:hypothetical protein
MANRLNASPLVKLIVILGFLSVMASLAFVVYKSYH